MLLAIDAGNTRVKWALFDAEGVVQSSGACFHSALNETALPNSDNVMISNVAGETIAKQLANKLTTAASVVWLQSQPTALGINNGYDKPETLGSDRWAAIVAAWQEYKASCIVVNVGTSVTIDTIIASDKAASFIGGVILPGLILMQKSLHNNTAQLSDFSHAFNLQRYNAGIGTNTQEAIQMGALSAITGAIKYACDALVIKAKHPPLIVISGGDANVIAQHYTQRFNPDNAEKTIRVVDNLVLLGLFSLHNDAQSNKTN